jgi:hypothetical protein
MPLFSRFRKSYGEIRRLIDIPAQQLAKMMGFAKGSTHPTGLLSP